MYRVSFIIHPQTTIFQENLYAFGVYLVNMFGFYGLFSFERRIPFTLVVTIQDCTGDISDNRTETLCIEFWRNFAELETRGIQELVGK